MFIGSLVSFTVSVLFRFVTMEVNRLLSDELTYELTIRGVKLGSTVAEKRSLLREALQRERSDAASDPVVHLDVNKELDICSTKLEELTGCIQEFDNNNRDNEYVRIKSRLLHVDGRLHRVSNNPSSSAVSVRIKSLLELVSGLFEALEDALNIARLCQPHESTSSLLDDPVPLLPQVTSHHSTHMNQVPTDNLIDFGEAPMNVSVPASRNDDLPQNWDSNTRLNQIARRLGDMHMSELPAQGHSRVAFTSPSREPVIQTFSTIPSGDNVGRFQPTSISQAVDLGLPYAPIWKWNISFDGKGSVVSFLEDLEEIAESRRVSVSQLFVSAAEFLKGDALLWYRPRKHTFTDWSDLKAKLRSAFLPHDYEANLWDDIRKRTQGAEEKIILFVSKMQGMFAKLSQPPTEEQQISVIRRNLLPHTYTGLALQDIRTIDELIRLGQVIEESHWRARQYSAPPTNYKMMQEPSLAYRPVSEHVRRVATLEQPSSSPSGHPTPSPANTNSAKPSGLTCWTCRKPGHTRVNCPDNKIACFRCGTRGYTIKTCPTCSKNGQRSQ